MNLKINNSHLLEGDNVTPILTKKNNKTFKEAGGTLDTLIIHYTAGSSAESSAKYLCRDDIKASAHIVIGRQGEIYQVVPFNKVSWHAGKSKYGGRVGYNKYSIGIELDNAGVLTKTGNEYQAWFGKKYLENEVMRATHRNEGDPRYWHIYTEKQLEVNEFVVTLLLEKYPKIKTILGHEEIAPGRKQDPGPAFPLDRFRKNLLAQDRDLDDESEVAAKLPKSGTVLSSKLNIREGAGASFDKISKPLKGGQEVQILDEENGWYKVKTEMEGWVSKGFIDTK